MKANKSHVFYTVCDELMELLEQRVKHDFQTDFSMFSTLNVKENGLMFS